MVPLIQRHAAAGRANIRLENKLLEKEMAIDMVVDILTERGYSITAECKEQIVPMRIDPETHSIINTTRQIWVFLVRFHAPSIRR